MKKIKESNAASAHAELAREDEEIAPLIQGGVTGSYGRRFKVILIQEGLGNFGNAFYYTRQALESAVPLFEGKKFMVDHPSESEERDRPERSVRDIAGYYERVHIEEQAGRAVLAGDLVVLSGDEYEWVRTQLRESLEYSKSHAGDLVGLSINANGDAEQVDLADLVAGNVVQVPQGALPKLHEAKALGITTVNVVNRFTAATSCDLVTEAGAGGKPVSLIEQEKPRMKIKAKEATQAKDKKAIDKTQEAAAKAKEAEPAAAGAAPAAGGVADEEQHDDEEKDKALIADMLKKFAKAADGKSDDSEESAPAADSEKSGDKKPADAEEPEESEETKEADIDEADMAMAHEAFKHAKEAFGAESEEAAKIACAAVHTAKAMASKKEAAEAAQKDPSQLNPGKKESAKAPAAKESETLIKLTAENAALKETIKKTEIENHLEKTLKESGLPMQVTKKFRECVGKPKSTAEIDEKFKIFNEAYRVGGEADELGFVITAEKQETSQGGGLDLSDCVKD